MKPADYSSKNKQAIFTVSDADYAVMALTMFDSVSKFYQDCDLFLFVIGTGTMNRLEGGVNVVYIGDVLDELDLSQRLAYYLQIELATSVRPHCFEFLFAQNYDRVIYLDPDIYVFRRMTEVDDLLDGNVNGIVTPHALQSIRSDVAVGGDNVFLQCGIYNMGFFALKNTSETMRMVVWWKEKLKWQCVVDLPNGFFVDQKWLDFLPAYFDAFHVLRLPTYNLAPWNSEHYKVLSDSKGNFFVDDFDTPVAFIHFSGVKRAEHHFLHLKEARRFYLDQLQKRKFMKLGLVNYEVKFKPANLFLDKVCTFLYKDYINSTKDTKSNPLIDPGFYNFLHGIDNETKFPIYIRKLYEILADIFIGYLGTQRAINYDNLIAWIKDSFPYDGVVSLETMVQLRNDSINVGPETKHTDNLAETTSQNRNDEQPYYPAILSFDDRRPHAANGDSSSVQEIMVQSDRIEIISGDIRICIPHIDETGTLLNLPNINAQDYTEIWVPSAYCEKKLRSVHGLSNLTVIPYPVIKPKYEVQKTGLPGNKFIVMLHHDFNQDFATQNPLASLSAFSEAFGQRNDALLVCFLTNVRQSKDYENLIAAFGDEKSAKIVEGTLDDGLYYSYLHYAHCLISLHRETAFGYALAEAMSLGKYVIATDNGGNTEYMNADNSFLVESPSSKNFVTKAAKILDSIYDDANVLNTKSKKAKLSIQKHLSPNSVGFLMQKRLERLRNPGDSGIVKSKPPVYKQLLRRAYGLLKPHLRKVPLFVRLYVKLRTIRARYYFTVTSDRDQIAAIMTILLKNVNRPGILE